MCVNRFCNKTSVHKSFLQQKAWLSRNFPDQLENIQPIQKISRLFGNFPGYLETFQAIRKISRQSGKYPDNWKFSKGLETSQCNFKGYKQKLSGWQCHPATQVFGPLIWVFTLCGLLVDRVPIWIGNLGWDTRLLVVTQGLGAPRVGVDNQLVSLIRHCVS